MKNKRIAKAGAVTLRHDTDGAAEILIITGSNGGWVMPMGSVEKDETPQEAAIREAQEEAGVVIDVGEALCEWESVDRKDRPYHCEFFLAQYAGETDWPERDRRKRRWVSPKKAKDRLSDVFHDALDQACKRIEQRLES